MPKLIKKKKEIKVKSESINYVCFKCDKSKKEVDFYRSNSVAYKKIPICKDCLMEMYNELLERYKDPNNAILRICNLYDIHYDNDLVRTLEKKDSPLSLMRNYITRINSLQQYKGMTFEDSGIRNTAVNVEGMADSLIEKEDILFWGKGYSQSEYEELNFFLDRWKKTHKHDTEGELQCLREICAIQLEIQKSRQAGRYDAKLAKDLRDWMQVAAVDPAKAKVSDSASSLDSYGMWIKDIEKEKPADYFKDKKIYNDFDGLKEYCENYIFRPLKNLLTGSRDFDITDKDTIFKKKSD
jgi:hypothetical protein